MRSYSPVDYDFDESDATDVPSISMERIDSIRKLLEDWEDQKSDYEWKLTSEGFEWMPAREQTPEAFGWKLPGLEQNPEKSGDKLSDREENPAGMLFRQNLFERKTGKGEVQQQIDGDEGDNEEEPQRELTWEDLPFEEPANDPLPADQDDELDWFDRNPYDENWFSQTAEQIQGREGEGDERDGPDDHPRYGETWFNQTIEQIRERENAIMAEFNGRILQLTELHNSNALEDEDEGDADDEADEDDEDEQDEQDEPTGFGFPFSLLRVPFSIYENARPEGEAENDSEAETEIEVEAEAEAENQGEGETENEENENPRPEPEPENNDDDDNENGGVEIPAGSEHQTQEDLWDEYWNEDEESDEDADSVGWGVGLSCSRGYRQADSMWKAEIKLEFEREMEMER